MGEPIRIEQVFHALDDDTRRGIVEMLGRKPHSVTQLANALGITLTAVVLHLRILEAAGLVHTHKLGRVRTATVDAAGLDVLTEWVRERRPVWERRLDKLQEILSEGDSKK